MATIIWKEAKPCGTARSRYKSRRAVMIAERRKYEALERKIAVAMAGCSRNVARATSLTTGKEHYTGSVCMPQTALYAVTGRSKTVTAL